jgi:hypothetical protein
MWNRRAKLHALAALALLLACRENPAPAPAPRPAPATASQLPAEEHLPPSVAGFLKEGVALEPGERALQLLTDGPVVVDPASRFRVVLGRRLPDARLVLVDGADAIVPGEGQKEVAESTTLTLAPSRPLDPGGLYVLRVDGAASREVHDDKGNSFLPLNVSITAAGAPQPPPPEPALRPAGARKKR